MSLFYNNYPTYLNKIFGKKVQKITINAGFSCPNRDGTVGFGGCTYCNNQSFNPDFCQVNKCVKQQIQDGIQFFSHKYKDMVYLAYFQAYTNTYATLDKLKSLYEEALSDDRIIGLVIGTRPDCVNHELLEYLSLLSKKYYVMIEYGIESTSDETLKLINRGHNYAVAQNAILETVKYHIPVCAHLILGLPKEDKEMILNHADIVSKLPLTSIKLHQLQIIKGTIMEKQLINNPEWFHLYTVDEYIDLLINFIARLNPNFVIERFISQSPKELLIAPNWGLKNYEFTNIIEKKLKDLNIHQGDLFKSIIV